MTGMILDLILLVGKFLISSKANRDRVKREINLQVKSILRNESNSSKLRKQAQKLEKEADEYLKGKNNE